MTSYQLDQQLAAGWQASLRDMITDPKELFAILDLDANLLEDAMAASNIFPLRVTRSFVSRMKKSDFNDPLLKQILPLGVELVRASGYEKDPLQEKKANPIPGLLHKYKGRVLITLTSACPIHCRFCFRRHFPYSENNPGKMGWEKIFQYIEKNKTIHEVILSGGDPLIVSDDMLMQFTQGLAPIFHLKRLRIHTRLPIMLPERITNEFLAWTSQLKQKLIIVIHCNHPQEINKPVKESLAKLKKAGITLLNQSVFLKGINDDLETLINLQETLFNAGVLPYYLHALDKVEGGAHFDLDINLAKKLHTELTNHLPGYLVPRFVCEIAGKPSKTLLSSSI